jgi:predicted DCC family thiol-disulfide oxidoreductase YuxK
MAASTTEAVAASPISRLEQAAESNPPESAYVGKHIMLYDGICSYCKGIVEASLNSDEQEQFFFAPLQGSFAQKALGRYGINSLELRSMYVISDYRTSDEALRAAAPASNFLLLRLSGELKKLGESNACKPRSVQDAEYKAIADTRYDTHPKLADVGVPEPSTRDRYIF